MVREASYEAIDVHTRAREGSYCPGLARGVVWDCGPLLRNVSDRDRLVIPPASRRFLGSRTALRSPRFRGGVFVYPWTPIYSNRKLKAYHSLLLSTTWRSPNWLVYSSEYDCATPDALSYSAALHFVEKRIS